MNERQEERRTDAGRLTKRPPARRSSTVRRSSTPPPGSFIRSRTVNQPRPAERAPRARHVNERVRPVKRATRLAPVTSRPREWRSTSTVTRRFRRREKVTRTSRPAARGVAAKRRIPAVLAHAAPTREKVPAPENASVRPQPANTTRTGPSVSTFSAAPQVIRARSGCTVTVPTLRTFSASESVRGFDGVVPHLRVCEA